MASLIPTQPSAMPQHPVQNPHLLEMQDLKNQYDAEKAKPNDQAKFTRLSELKKSIATKQTVMEEWTACNLRLNEKRDGINERLEKAVDDEDWGNCGAIQTELDELSDSVEALLLFEAEAEKEKVKKEGEKKIAEKRAKTNCPICDHKYCNNSNAWYMANNRQGMWEEATDYRYCQDDQTFVRTCQPENMTKKFGSAKYVRIVGRGESERACGKCRLNSSGNNMHSGYNNYEKTLCK